ncbi:MAG TPA: pilin [Candidatus Saccharimonadaceae bacterium]|nr:pilin [Candidatus Saccharimonadaceae bacterium]
MKRLKQLIVALGIIVGSVGIVGSAAPAYACSTAIDCATQGYQDSGGSANGGVNFQGFIKKIVNLLLYVLGAVAVIMIVIGGVRYTTSNGDSSQTKGAKDTIMYAVIGLIVAVLAYSIVNFVLKSL